MNPALWAAKTGLDAQQTRMTVTSLDDVSEEPLPLGKLDLSVPRIQTLV